MSGGYQVDAVRVAREALLLAGNAAAASHSARLGAALTALRAEVGTRIWTPVIPESAGYTGLTKAIWFYQAPGAGPDENTGDSGYSFAFTCLGGRVGGTANGGLDGRLADEVARALIETWSLLGGVVTPYGVLAATSVESGPHYDVDTETGWPYAKCVLGAEIGD